MTPLTTPAKILHVATVPMSTVFLRGQVGFIKELGFKIEILTSPGPDLDRFGEEEGVPVHAVPMPRRITPLADLRALSGIRRVIRRTRPTIVHSHTPKGGLLGMVAASLERVPIRIYQMRGLAMMTASGFKRDLLSWAERTSCRLADEVICNSFSMRAFAIGEGLLAPSEGAVLCGGSGNGVDSGGKFDPSRLPEGTRASVRRELGIPEDALVVGFVGRIVRDKGAVELAEAWSALRSRFPDAHLMMVGPFEPQDPVPEATERLLREDARVHLLGMNWDTPPFYSAMDVVVLPTYREGFPNVPLEAASMELPVVTTAVPGCTDAVTDGVTGLLVPPFDSDALAGAIQTYLEDPDLRREHGEAGRARVLKQFQQERIWDALHGVYLSHLERL